MTSIPVTHQAAVPHPLAQAPSGSANPTRWRQSLAQVRQGLLCASVFCFVGLACRAQSTQPAAAPPDSPTPQVAAHPASPPSACQVHRDSITQAWTVAAEAAATLPRPTAAAAAGGLTEPLPDARIPSAPAQLPCPLLPIVDWYARFLDGPQVKAMTPKQKAWLAVRNVADPFNAITILGSSAIAVAANSHSDYGPGMPGFGRYVGVSYSQDLTGEFIGTFLIPSLVHQDPHYHRWPHASFKRRVAHCLFQVVWTQGDNGREMLNYANIAGFAIEDEIGNLYVPGQQTRLTASSVRYGTDFATAPIENFVTEFLPDIARKIHVRVVLIQRIINQVARTGPSTTGP